MVLADALDAMQFGHNFLRKLSVMFHGRRVKERVHLSAAHLGDQDVVDGRFGWPVTEQLVLPASCAEGQVR